MTMDGVMSRKYSVRQKVDNTGIAGRGEMESYIFLTLTGTNVLSEWLNI